MSDFDWFTTSGNLRLQTSTTAPANLFLCFYNGSRCGSQSNSCDKVAVHLDTPCNLKQQYPVLKRFKHTRLITRLPDTTEHNQVRVGCSFLYNHSNSRRQTRCLSPSMLSSFSLVSELSVMRDAHGRHVAG